MNIFATHEKPNDCARILDDKRLNKMTLETAQLLSNYFGGPYRPTHTNHPCYLWMYESTANVVWLFDYFFALLQEYRTRRGKDHGSRKVFDHIGTRFFDLQCHAHELGKQRTPFRNVTTFKSAPVHEAYRCYLLNKWEKDKRRPTWYGKQQFPGW